MNDNSPLSPTERIVGLFYLFIQDFIMTFEKNNYQIPTWIKYAIASDRVVIMDLRTGKYILFEEVASEMWIQLLSEDDLKTSISTIARKFNVELSQCENDFLEFMKICQESGFITPVPIIDITLIKKNIQIKSANVFTAWTCILKTRRAFRKLQFSEIYGKYGQLSKPKNPIITDSFLNSSLITFRKAENFFSVINARFDCLPRSLALFRFLISIGIPCDHCIGIQRYPFIAHAWVEVKNKIVGDDDNFISKFIVINRI